MKALVYANYGGPEVLQLKEVEKPAPKEHEILIKVQAASINAADWHLLTADIFLVRLNMGLFRPKHAILGCDIAGQVEAVGSAVTRFRPGDAVFGDVFNHGYGGFAEYVTASESDLALKPARLSYAEAAAVPLAARTALQGLRDLGQIQPGHKVLINGASGGVGTFAVQLANYFGAHVTAVCSTRNLDLARSLGADRVIDYTQEDFTQMGQQYDLILAVNGYHPISNYRRVLSPKGRYVMIGGSLPQLFEVMLHGSRMSHKDGQQFRALTLKPNSGDLPLLQELLESCTIAPIIDRQYSLSDASEAFRYFGEGHAKGKIVITMTQNRRLE